MSETLTSKPADAPLATAAPASASPNQVKLVVATPCFGGQISVLYAGSLFKLQSVVHSYSDVSLKILFKDGDALITRARASLISQFLDDPGRNAFAVCRCRYRFRAGPGLAPDRVRRRHVRGGLSDQAHRLGQGQDGNRDPRGRIRPRRRCNMCLKSKTPMRSIAKGGFVKVRYAGTGFLMIRRAALERMCALYPQLRYKRDHSLDAASSSENRFALFENMIAEDGTYLSEDFAFCKRWTDIGGEIWADLSSKLNHVGPMAFCGELSSQFVGN